MKTWSLLGSRGAFLAACVLAACLAGAGQAAPALKTYRYGEAWWWEPREDTDTCLLLHFGPPAERGVERAAREADQDRARRKQEEDLFSLEKLDETARDTLPKMTPEDLAFKPAPVKEPRAAEGFVLDYGWNRREFPMGERAGKVVPDGRFGAGLELAGGALVLPGVQYRTPAKADGQGASVDLWLRVSQYPERPACVWEVAGGRPGVAGNEGAQLLLHPDGRLQLKLRESHGRPNRDHWTAEQLRGILATPGAVLFAKRPVPLDRWVHVRCYNEPPTVQGAGSPMGVYLSLNGVVQASYISEVSNDYNFLGRSEGSWWLGNSAKGDLPFRGRLDEFRILHRLKAFYPTPEQDWRDAAAKRPLKFGPPWFLADGAVFHASFDRGNAFDFQKADPAAQIEYGPQAGPPVAGAAEADGIRGKARLVDVNLGFARFSLKGMNAQHGVLECWVRPENFDNYTRGYGPLPPHPLLSTARFYGKDRRDGQVKVFQELLLPRADSADGTPRDFHPGQWYHLAVEWGHHDCVFLDGTGWRRYTRGPQDLLDNIEPLYVEFGIPDDVRVARDERPRIAVDEVVGYNYTLEPREVVQALKRWQGEIEPLRLYTAAVQYKRPIGEWSLTITPAFPPDRKPGKARVTLKDEETRVEPTRATKTAVAAVGPAAAQSAVAAVGSTASQAADAAAEKANGSGRASGRGAPQAAGRADPRHKEEAAPRAEVRHIAGKPLEAPFADGKATLVLGEGCSLAAGRYRFDIELTDDKGATVVRDTLDWSYQPEAWLDNRLGILDAPPPPWTPVKVEQNRVSTRMTAYVLEPNGLPREILADGRNLLAGPVQLLEADRPMTADTFRLESVKAVEAVWSSVFHGKTWDVEARWTCEYDGMVRYELRLTPKAEAREPLRLVIPMQAKHATRLLWQQVEAQNADTAVLPASQGRVWSSRDDGLRAANAARQRQKQPPLDDAGYEAWHFCAVVDLNDRERGLYWFAQNAAGWQQSKTTPAQAIEREGDVVRLVLNLVAGQDREPSTANDSNRAEPIVFGLLPHPARPVAPHYRLLDRPTPNADPAHQGAYGTVFMPWPMEPRADNMELFPRPDPEAPDKGASYGYAERCAKNFKLSRPDGFRTMYLSKYWLSCRAGAYDGWEWRSGPSAAATLNQRFVEYLCWEMNEWIGRDIYNAIYVDENYPVPSRDAVAGLGVRLPDGTIQPGEPCWATRELFKRWRNLFHAHGKPPMLISHHTGSFPYHSVVFCDSYLDGEGRPMITAGAPDFVDGLPLQRAESLQNGRLWGVTPFYMVSIWEGGLGKGKDWNPHRVWSWRMARGAMSVLAHFENGATYTDQGASVYGDYWRDVLKWGAADPAVSFVPYWQAGEYLSADDLGEQILVSFYRKPAGALLIVSNRAREDREVAIRLNREALGLTGTPKVRDRDTGHTPPAGEDIPTAKQLTALKAEAAVGGGEAPFDIDAFLGEKKPNAPRLENGVLLVPVRARDFRLVEVE